MLRDSACLWTPGVLLVSPSCWWPSRAFYWEAGWRVSLQVRVRVNVDPEVSILETSTCLHGRVPLLASVSSSTSHLCRGEAALSSPTTGWLTNSQQALSESDATCKYINIVILKPQLTRFLFYIFLEEESAKRWVSVVFLPFPSLQ